MKLLFIRFSSLGDTILLTGVLKEIKRAIPSAEIYVFTSDEFCDVFADLPFVDVVYGLRRKAFLSEVKSFAKTLPAFAHIFDFHGTSRSRYACLFLKGQVHRYNKNALARRLYAIFRIKLPSLRKHVAERYMETAAKALDIEMPSLEALRPFLRDKGKVCQGKVVLHPFASRNTKIWPYFAELAGRLAQSGKEVYIIGQDRSLITEAVFVETKSLSELFSFLSDAEYVVSGDSGPMHAACALGVPLLAIFGGTTREFGFFPLFDNCTVVEREGLSCRPCDVHGLKSCPKEHFRCMREILPDEIMEKMGYGV